MELWEATKLAFKNYATFTGRTSRPDYWYFFLAMFIGNAIASVIDDDVQRVFAIATLLPGITAAARRLRDTGKPMTNFLWLLVPVVGWIIFLIQLAQPSQEATQNSQ